jgi:hypothetical protein
MATVSNGVFAMIWIDRLGLVWAAVLWGIMALLANGHGHAADALHPEVIKAVALLAGGPWLLLRGARFMLFGSGRRYRY